MSLSKILATSSFFLSSQVSSHSWLHCSDYDGTISGQDFDESLCNGYIRGWSSIWGGTSFATDRGVNYQASGGNWCQSGFSTPIADMYDDGYPAATWSYGETVTLVWPAKNHANYECFSNIPDTSMKLYYNPTANPDSEPSSSSTVTDDWSLLIDWQDGCTAGSDGCGFQNCPDFCEDTDGAPCWQKYTVSQDDFPSAGYYTLMWYWIFNPGSPYTTCFEVYIDGETVTDTGGGNTGNTGTDTDTDTNGGTNNGNDDDDDDEETSYIVQIPICYSGAAYDESTLIDGANNAAYDSATTVDWDVTGDVYEDGTDWNATIQTQTNDAGDVTSLAYDYSDSSSDICDSIESEFGTGTCEICDPGTMKTYTSSLSTSSGGSSSDDSGSGAIIAVVVVLIIVFLIIGAGIGYQKMQEKKSAESGNENGMSQHVAGQTNATQKPHHIVQDTN